MAPRGRIQADSDQAKRWLIVGAFQAGASERTVARISGLSSTAVRKIYLNYRQTGIPSLPKQLSRRVKQKLVVEYDENGNLLDDSSDEEEEEIVREIPPEAKSSSTKIARLPSTKDVIAYVADQVNRPSIDPMHVDHTSPDMESALTMTPSLGGSSPSTSTAYWRPLTPPRDHSGDEKSPTIVNSSLLPPSPPLQATKSTSSKVPALPPVRKFSQSIRGYERWTEDDDKMLMAYILKRMRGDNWNNLAARFGGRHSSSCCKQRWEYLQRRLLKHIALPTTSLTSTNMLSAQGTRTEQ